MGIGDFDLGEETLGNEEDNNMGAPAGSKGYVTVTINAAKVGETNSHFPWLYDLSKITDATWWANVTAAGDIVVVAPDGSTIVPRIVDVLDTAGKTGTILWDASVSTSANQAYQIHACPGYGAVNASAALTNSSCVIRHGMDGSASPLVDSCGNYNLTNVGATLAQAGKIGKSVLIGGGANRLTTPKITQIGNATKWSESILFYPTDITTYQNLQKEQTTNFGWIQIASGSLYLSWFGAAIYGTLASLASFVNLNAWNRISFVYDGSLTGNDARLKLYINGVPMTFSAWAGTVGTSLDATGTGWIYGLATDSFLNSIDESRHYTDAKSAGWDLTEYNAIFDAGAVTTGAWVPASTGGNGVNILGFGFRFGF